MDGLSVYFTKEWLTCSDEPPSHYTVLMAASLWILSSLTAIHYSPKPGRVATTFGGIFHLLFEVGVNGTSFIACEMIAVDRRNTFYIYILLFISPTCTQTHISAYVYNVFAYLQKIYLCIGIWIRRNISRNRVTRFWLNDPLKFFIEQNRL